MALNQINVIRPGKEAESGGGALGGILGGILAAGAVIATGGAALPLAAAIPAVLGAAGGGSGLGSLVGGVLSPGSQAESGQEIGVKQLPKTSGDSALQRRFNSSQGPTAGMGESRNQLSELEDSMRALAQAPQDLQRQHAGTMLGAHSILSRRG